MKQETFIKIYQEELTPKQKKVIPLFLAGKSDEEIAIEIGVTHRTAATHHLRNIARKFGLPPETEVDYKAKLIELFAQHKPEIVSKKALEKYGLTSYKIRFPTGPEPLNSPFYLERNPIEAQCYAAIKEAGALIRIKAPKQMGKTSLIKRIIAQNNYHTVYLNFSLIEQERFKNHRNFLRGFYAYIRKEIQNAPLLTQWDEDTPIMIKLTCQMQLLLNQLSGVLLLILDEVDTLFKHPNIYENFFPLLRNWNEKANESETWEKLRLIVCHSTEDYGKLDINQSPFNVGFPIKLEEFTPEQVAILAMRHGINKQDTIPLMSMVGGHPYLIRLALYHLVTQNLKINQLMQEAPRENGIYHQHLLRHLETLQQHPELANIYKKIVSSTQPISLKKETMHLYQLESMGLINYQENQIIPRCQLYRLYFPSRL